MKKAIGWLASWALFWAGHFVSRGLMHGQLLEESLYPIYNWLMNTSCHVQDWGGGGPWEDVTDDDRE